MAAPGVVEDSVGLALPEGKVGVPVVGSAVSVPVPGTVVSVEPKLVGVWVLDPGLAVLEGSGVGVPEGLVPRVGEGAASTCAKEPSAAEARGKYRNNRNPASVRAPAGLNRETFTPSS